MIQWTIKQLYLISTVAVIGIYAACCDTFQGTVPGIITQTEYPNAYSWRPSGNINDSLLECKLT